MLITNIQDITDWVEISAQLDLDHFKPHITQVQNQYLLPAFGPALFNQLDTFINAQSPAAHVATLKPLVNATIAPLAVALKLKTDIAKLGSSGTFETSQDGQMPTRQWAFKEALNSHLDAGTNALDVLLNYLNDNVQTYTEFTKSPYYLIDKAALISNVQEFNKHYNINSSVRTFKAIQKHLNHAFNFYILPVIQQAFWAALSVKKQNSTLSDLENSLINIAQSSLAHFAVAQAIKILPFQIQPNGVFHLGLEGRETIEKSTQASYEHTTKIANNLNIIANNNLALLKKFITDNASTFTDYISPTPPVVEKSTEPIKTAII